MRDEPEHEENSPVAPCDRERQVEPMRVVPLLSGLRELSRVYGALLLALLVSGLTIGCRHAPPLEVEVQVQGVGFDPAALSPVVVLHDPQTQRRLPIWIGAPEAQAISHALDGVVPPRPQSHDLMKTLLEESGSEVERVVVSGYEANTYRAQIHLRQGRRSVVVDGRPSDAIALALRMQRPILVAEVLLQLPPGTVRRLGEEARTVMLGPATVQQLTPELAEHFEIPAMEGLLVADVGPGTDLRRGDLILAVNGTAMGRIGELRRLLDEVPAGSVLQLTVRRERDRFQVELALPAS